MTTKRLLFKWAVSNAKLEKEKIITDEAHNAEVDGSFFSCWYSKTSQY